MDAGLSDWWRLRAIVRELTGSPVWIYERTMECKISCSRAFSVSSPCIDRFKTLLLHYRLYSVEKQRVNSGQPMFQSHDAQVLFLDRIAGLSSQTGGWSGHPEGTSACF